MNQQHRKEYLDIGWTTVTRESLLDGNSLSRQYWGLQSILRDGGPRAMVRMDSPWVISDLEETLRSALLFYPEVVVELPYAQGIEDNPDWSASIFLTGQYEVADWDERPRGYGSCWCEYSFLTFDALETLSGILGDGLSRGEIRLLPTFDPRWDEVEEEEYPIQGTEEVAVIPTGAPAWPYELETLWRPFNAVWPLLTGPSITVAKHVVVDETLSLPVLKNISLRDLLRIRRDEGDAFFRWLTYIEPLLKGESAAPREVAEAIRTGISELDERFRKLRIKGTLDAVGAVLASSSLAIASLTASGPVALAGLLTAAGSLAAMHAKTLYEMRDSRRSVQDDPRYFVWLVNR